jgi:hypothetical protein
MWPIIDMISVESARNTAVNLLLMLMRSKCWPEIGLTIVINIDSHVHVDGADGLD